MNPQTMDIEEQVRREVSVEQLQAHLGVFSQLFRDSGSEDERKAAEYIAAQLEEYGVEAEIHEFDSLISWPLEGRLEILDSRGNLIEEIEVRTRSFGAQSPPGGMRAELLHVPYERQSDSEPMLSNRTAAGDYAGQNVEGKIVISTDGGPGGVLRAQQHGASGHIHIWPSDENVVHEMISTSIWGTPTPDSATRLPTIPSLGIKHADGDRIVGMLENRVLQARIESNVKTEWMRLPLVTGFIPGSMSEDFLLVGGHIDSWYEGVTDNATGDASIIEMARVLVSVQDRLRCGVRFCWWPGHSTGRYSGSTWYADTFFNELREHALGYLNIDSPGVRETAIWDCRYNCAEVEDITASAVSELSGLEPNTRRPVRAGDQSFLGVGLPSLGAFRMLPLDHPDRKAVGGGGGAYWWHSPEDTLDKADAEILARDTEIYVTITLRMCCPDVIPYDYAKTAQDFIDRLSTYQDAGGDHLDLSSTIMAAQGFKDLATELAMIETDDVAEVNNVLKRIGRILNPVLFTLNGPYEMDPATQVPLIPGLASIGQLRSLDRESNVYGFLRTKLVRERNRVDDALRQANWIARRLTKKRG